MIPIKKFTIVAMVSTLAFIASTPQTQANTSKTGAVYSGSQNSYTLSGRHTPAPNGTFLDGSITATQYYKAGLNRYNKGKLRKAEESFKAVLRARGLNKQALFYLAKIKQKQGDIEKANEYTRAYDSIN